MKFIGITGGVGAGKSAVLDYMATKPGVRVMLADEIAHELMEPERTVMSRSDRLFRSMIFIRKMDILTG